MAGAVGCRMDKAWVQVLAPLAPLANSFAVPVMAWAHRAWEPKWGGAWGPPGSRPMRWVDPSSHAWGRVLAWLPSWPWHLLWPCAASPRMAPSPHHCLKWTPLMVPSSMHPPRCGPMWARMGRLMQGQWCRFGGPPPWPLVAAKGTMPRTSVCTC